MEQQQLKKLIPSAYHYQENMNDVMDALRALHYEEGTSMADFAKMLGFSYNSVQRLLAKRTQKMSFMRLTHLIKVLIARGY